MARQHSRIEQAAIRYRQRLADLERNYAQTTGPQRRAAIDRIRRLSLDLVEELRAAGLPPEVSERWVTSSRSWQRLALAAREELDDLSVEAARAIQWQVAAAAEAGADAAIGLFDMVDDSANFGLVPSAAVEAAVGVFQPGTVFSELPGLNQETVRQIGREVTRGLASGLHSRVIARNIANTTSVPSARAATIARTETFRAYREANREIYKQHRLVKEWRWVCSLGERTCSACWSMHGSLHPVEEPMGTHPNCRCTMIPTIPNSFNGPTGEELFNDLDPDQQRTILGQSKYDAFKRGDIKLADTVRVMKTKEWGTTRSVSSLKQAKASAGVKTGKPSVKKTPAAPRRPASKITLESTVKNHPAEKNMKEAFKIIEKVHAPKAQVVFDGDPHKSGLLGSFGRYREFGDMVGRIGVKPGEQATLTAIHEMGHLLDLQMFGSLNARGYSLYGSDSARFKASQMHAWHKAVRASGSRERIAEHYRYDTSYRNYLLKNSEQFARSYEQWIGTKTNSAAFKEKLKKWPSMYWTEEEFRPILKELDKLFGV